MVPDGAFVTHVIAAAISHDGELLALRARLSDGAMAELLLPVDEIAQRAEIIDGTDWTLPGGLPALH